MPDMMVLPTKYIIPPLPKDVIYRSRLIGKVDENTQKKLILVNAPPGYGKSTLLAQWAAQNQRPIIWLNLDEEDNNYARFQWIVIEAMRSLFKDRQHPPEFDELNTLPLSHTEFVGYCAKMISFLDEDVVLVLDDFHVITNSEIHDGMQYYLDHLLPNFHIIISSRTVPPLSIQRMRVIRMATEITVEDLRLNRSEIEAFFQNSCARCLSRDQLGEIERRTEGWAACLQLALLSVKDLDLEQTQQFMSYFTSSNRFVSEYLLEEIYSRFPQEVRSFLTQTSILRHLNASLADEVTQRKDGRKMIDLLQQANLLLPLDNNRQWYRYTPIISDFLFNMLEEEIGLEGIQELHFRASVWYERAGILSDAVNHAFASPTTDRAGVLLNKITEDTNLSEAFNWQTHFLKLPDEVLFSFPDACINCAWSLILAKDLAAVERPLWIAEKAWQIGENREELGRVYHIKGFLSRYLGDLNAAIEHSQKALELLSEDEPHRRGGTMFTLAMAHFQLGRAAIAEPLLIQARELTREHGDKYSEGLMTASLPRIYHVMGKLSQAEGIFLQVSQSIDPKLYDQVLSANIFLGAIYHEQNRLDLAEKHLLTGLNKENYSKIGRYWPYGLVELAMVYWEKGQPEKSAQVIDQAYMMVKQLDNKRDRYRINAAEARLALLEGDLEAAQNIMAHIPGLKEEYLLDHKLYYEWTAQLRLWIAQGDQDQTAVKLNEAVNALDLLLNKAVDEGRGRDEIELLVLKALALWHLGEKQEGLKALVSALEKGEKEKFVRRFINEGQPIADLLVMALKQNIYPAYVSELLAAFYQHGEMIAELEAGTDEEHLLSQREVEVLKAISEGYSTQEIAEMFVLSPYTVRTHVRNIFNKLEVHNRMQAVEIARAQQLI